MKRTILLPALLLALGTGLLLWPRAGEARTQWGQLRDIRRYDRLVEALSPRELEAARRGGLSLPGTDLLGYLEIPALDQLLPIRPLTGEAALDSAVCHVPGSSLPLGGAGTHAALSGHRGLPGARLFTDLHKLREGDRFYLHILGEKLTYQVDRITVVLPQQTQELLPEEGEDLCTLVTCTPYGINSHRLLVRGRRAEEKAPAEL